MPSTPQVKFNFINNNVEESSPLQGISIVLARTTKGEPKNPSALITSISQFQRTYGSEIVPDGSVSNIERALIGGSKLRIIRVMGSGATQGAVGDPKKDSSIYLFKVKIGNREAYFKLVTRGYGDPIGTGSTFTVKTTKAGNTLYYEVIDENGSTIESGPVFTYFSADANNLTSIDYLALSTWINTNPYFKASTYIKDIKDITEGTENVDPEPISIEKFLQWLAETDGTKEEITVTPTASLTGSIGSAGSDPELAEWKAAAEYIRDYTDAYNILASHASSHLGADAIQLYKVIKDMCDELNEFRFFIEVPKFDTDGVTPLTDDKIVAWKQTCAGTIGHSKWVSYYAGGLIYNNIYGIPQGSDVGGTVLGLADASATNYGYDKSFAGLNRGIATDAQGPVSQNYGSPGRISSLEKLAQACINIFVIRDTPSFGKRTVLWHNFTDQVKQDSFRFIGNTGLVLNIKKTLRPILESFIEEPNIWGTWHDIYLRVRPYIDAWVDAEAMTDPVWNGDQDANSWDDLKVNTEAECRQGHYHVVFSFKDIVALQDITLDVVIEKASKSISIDVVDNS